MEPSIETYRSSLIKYPPISTCICKAIMVSVNYRQSLEHLVHTMMPGQLSDRLNQEISFKVETTKVFEKFKI
ncbi:hypothetical protein J1N35_005229 [Gossypium stocksii]|uniref:Uncharacterized protein n=1 Tax=Gossypium stocksii TaxID=47602 RepID=A0A9D3WCH2_9ROSI|nr:hypothetical protein J1N35_005229 [Gossypium stocksii]